MRRYLIMKVLAIVSVAVAMLLIGCGGGGGGSAGTGGSTGTTGTTGSTTSGTTGNSPCNGGRFDTIVGQVVDESRNQGVPNVEVFFVDGQGNTVMTARSNSSGCFSANVPSSAVRFGLTAGTIPRSFYASFRYNGFVYAPLISTCTAPLPPITPNQATRLPDVVRLQPTSGPPPPPPTGCQ